jgi:hypothetical protein
MRKSILALVFVACCSILAAQQTMNNDAVIKLAKAGFSDDQIVSIIAMAPGAYDTSADGLIALKTAGVSDKVVSAIVMKSSAPPSSNSTVPPQPQVPSNGLPVGIDQVGVYYKNPDGAWTAVSPELASYRMGSMLKVIATEGIAGTNTKGHLEGPRASLSVSLPVTLAVYVPEGVAVEEYYLLRFQLKGSSREFHAMSGAWNMKNEMSKDAVRFAPEKIAPRVYQIKLDASLGRGEFGFVPPAPTGGYVGGTGKVYCFSVN